MFVTAIIPTYNRAALVREAIESALNQTRPPDEIFVIDDGSTDDTGARLAAFGNRVTYVRQPNRGVSAARNLGLSMASGDYIAFLDSDDLWERHKLEAQLAVLERLPNLHLLFTEFSILREDGTRNPGGTRRWLPSGTDLGSMYDQSRTIAELGIVAAGLVPSVRVHFGRVYGRMLHEAYGLTSTAIIRRAAVDDGLKFTEGVSLYEDWEFYARLARQFEVGFLEAETALNRSHRGAERLTRETRLAKARCYMGLVDRVWLSDVGFVDGHRVELTEVASRALLAIGREAVLAGRPEEALGALGRWRTLGSRNGMGLARIVSLCARIPGGPVLLRSWLRASTFLKVLRGKHETRYTVKPAA